MLTLIQHTTQSTCFLLVNQKKNARFDKTKKLGTIYVACNIKYLLFQKVPLYYQIYKDDEKKKLPNIQNQLSILNLF